MDVALLAAALLLVVYGLVMVLSSSAFWAEKRVDDAFYFFSRQCVFAGLGLIAMGIASRFHFSNYRKLVYPLLVFTALLLSLVLVPGFSDRTLGAKRWLALGPFHLQPSELAKFAVINYVAYSLTKPKAQGEGFMIEYFRHLMIPLVVLTLIVVEPDFGTAFLILFAAMLTLVVAGSPLRYPMAMGAAAVPFLALLLAVFPHGMMRLRNFVDQIKFIGSEGDYSLLCYQVRESVISLGSGRLWGMGLGDGTLKMFFLPQAHSDFILATLGQELGFAGVAALFVLFGLLLARGYQIAYRVPDTFGCYLAFGITTILMLQILINVGVVLGVLPPKGIALPFISYGGSSLVVALFMVGILLNISRHTVNFVNPKRGAP